MRRKNRHLDDLANIRLISSNIGNVIKLILELVKIGDTIKEAQKSAGPGYVSRFDLPKVGSSTLSKLTYPLRAAVSKIKNGGLKVVGIAYLHNMLKEIQKTAHAFVIELHNKNLELDKEFSNGIGSGDNSLQRVFKQLHLSASIVYRRLDKVIDNLSLSLLSKTSKPAPQDVKKSPQRIFKEEPGVRYVSSGNKDVEVLYSPQSRASLGFKRLNRFGSTPSSSSPQVYDLTSSDYSIKKDSRYFDSAAGGVLDLLNNIKLSASYLRSGNIREAFAVITLSKDLARFAYNDWCERKKKDLIDITFTSGNRKERLINFIKSIGRSIIDAEKAKAILFKMKDYIKEGKLKDSLILLIKKVGDLLKVMVKLKSDAGQQSRNQQAEFTAIPKIALPRIS